MPASLTSLLREEVRAIDPDLPLFDIRTMDQQLAQQRWPFRMFGTHVRDLRGHRAGAVGGRPLRGHRVFGVAADAGDRRADGARRPGRSGVVADPAAVVVQLAIGLAIGIAGAFGVGQLLDSVLVQTGIARPVTLTSIVALLMLVSMAACYLAGAAGDAARSGRPP